MKRLRGRPEGMHAPNETVPPSGTATDVAEPRRREDELLAVNADLAREVTRLNAEVSALRRFRSLIERSPDEVYLADRDGRLAYVNAAAASSLGYTVEEMLDLGMRGLDVGRFGAAHAFREHFEALEAGPQPPIATVHRAKDGRAVAKELRAVVLDSGEREDVCLFGRDGHAQATLEEYRRMLQLVLDTIPARVFWKDRDSVYLGCNRLFATDGGLESPAEILGRNDFELGWSEQAELYRADDRQVMESGVPKLGYEEPQTTPEGRRIWLRTSKVPLRDERGVVIGVLGTYEDITDRKEAEENVRSLNADLERRVRERTIDLESLNKEWEAFSYSVSHDLRAPLRHILGFISLVRDRAGAVLDEESRRCLGVVTDAARHMARLIDELLALSRTGRAELCYEDVDLDTLVREAVAEAQRDLRDRRINWAIGPLPRVRADATLLRQVWANLLGNAVKYTRPRPVAEIQIGCRAGDGDGTVFYVRDNGVGFDSRFVARLFRVFQRLHSPEQFEGNGIGLANVQRIIERHGGRTWAEGAVDEGAVFYFTLP